jgi:uncharacterized pyridoxal phosphate-containing UPF0001 family protein
MENACARAGRQFESVELIAVSKLHEATLIRDCHSAGQRDFGENYAQELRDKAVKLADLPDLRWHAIGPLQTNKAKYVAKHARAFHALDSVKLAEELSRRRSGEALRCYIEVNLASEKSMPGLEVMGLMCLPPLASDPETSRPYFKRLRDLALALELSGLSMGTTADFEVAIEEGATAVRVGTAIFGERPSALTPPP